MVHGKLLLQQQQLLRACVRACAAACVIDTISQLTRRRRPRRGESNLAPELVLRGRPKPVDISIRKFDSPRLD
jgi:hypothetical protein